MKIVKKNNKVTLYSDDDFKEVNRKLMRVVDNGNGYTIKAYSWSSVYADKYWSIDYAEAADLVECLKYMED